MKDGKPLRRTPLKRGESSLRRSPLNRGDGGLKRSKLNQRSKKMDAKYVERREIVEDMLKSYPHCVACEIFHVKDRKPGLSYVRPSQDVHELINRSQGGSIFDSRNLLTLCRAYHSRITINPKEAEGLGLHLESWCNTDLHFNEAKRVRDEWQTGTTTAPYWFSN